MKAVKMIARYNFIIKSYCLGEDTIKNSLYLLLLIFFSTLAAMAYYPNSVLIVLSPIIVFMTVCFVYRDEILTYDYNSTIRSSEFWSNTYGAFIFGIAIQGAMNLIAIQSLNIQPPDLSFAFNIVAAPAVSVIFSAVNEEIIFRKIIFGKLNSKFGFWTGSIISSVAFALCHYNFAGWIGYFAIGMVWCYFYKRTKNIAIPIIAHMVVNLVFFMKVTFFGHV